MSEISIQSKSAEIDQVQHFLSRFKKSGQFIYVEQIDKMQALQSTYITVDFNDIITESVEGGLLQTDFLKKIISNFFEVSTIFSEAVYNILAERFPSYAASIKGKIKVRLTNFSLVKKIREINADTYGKLVKITGIITKAMFPATSLINITLACSAGHRTPITKEKDFGGFVMPLKCSDDKCTLRNLRVDMDNSEFIDFQMLTIQELPEELPAGKTPHPILAYASRDLVDLARPGDRVLVTGISYPKGLEDAQSPLRINQSTFRPQIIANNIEVVNANLTEMDLPPEDIKYLERFQASPDLDKKLIASFDPDTKGHEIEKEAILYLLAAPNQEIRKNGTRRRGDINIVFVGDPGVAKSQMLKFAVRVAPRGIYTSGRGSTAVGLTAGVLKDQKTGFYVLEAGAFVLADLGVCVIDEFDKLKPEDRSALHEGMEQQSVTVAKGDIKATLNARTAVLAAANPLYGKYDPFKSLIENFNIPIPLLTRFDLVFIVRDIPNPKIDGEIADHILDDNEHVGPLSPDYLTKYLIFIKRKNPALTDAAKIKVKKFYLKMRSIEADGVTITPRQLEACRRLARARARLYGKDVADEEDVERAIQIVEYMFETAGTDVNTGRIDLGILSGYSKADQAKKSLFVDIIKSLQGSHNEPIERGILIKEMVKTTKWDEQTAKDFVLNMLKESIIFESRPGHYSRVV